MWKWILLAVFYSLNAFANEKICLPLEPNFWNNSGLPFIAFKGEGRFGAGIGMNVQYAPIRNLRGALEAKLGKRLMYFRGWNPGGEAHVTVITPLEYFDILKSHVSMEEIAKIARAHRIQTSDLRVQGVGSGRALINDSSEETYFLLIESRNIRRFRKAVHTAFVAKGGNPSAWNPDHYFPHVTIGFTQRDLHESDGVLKDARNSLDRRFRIAPGQCNSSER
ncbi:MAG: hypothetical protein A2X94_15130 [Bdellovibrionales bacterium GWB1_55_8]|nr:MAG: hypothetical protein A2X94_15130 [Bdellovibrionales bacterium GWB1_55_8]